MSENYRADLIIYQQNSLTHYGVEGMRWGVRRYQNADGSYTAAGRQRYAKKAAETAYNIRNIKLSQEKTNNFKEYQKLGKKVRKKTEKYEHQTAQLSKEDISYGRKVVSSGRLARRSIASIAGVATTTSMFVVASTNPLIGFPGMILGTAITGTALRDIPFYTKEWCANKNAAMPS